jgi:hypothetical protein
VGRLQTGLPVLVGGRSSVGRGDPHAHRPATLFVFLQIEPQHFSEGADAVPLVFGRQDTGGGVDEKLLRRANVGIHPQRFSAIFGTPDTAKPALGGLRWCFNWWAGGI